MVLRHGFGGGGTVLGLLLLGSLQGCAVVAVADAAVTVGVTAVKVGATVVKVGATVVETAVDVTAAGVKAVVHAGDKE